MYAVVKTGGKQYRVEPGTIIEVELLEGDKGASVELSDVLLIGSDSDVKVGQPLVKGAVVVGEIIEQNKKAAKVVIYKKLKRHGKRLKKGHRQQLTKIKVSDIRVS